LLPRTDANCQASVAVSIAVLKRAVSSPLRSKAFVQRRQDRRRTASE